MSACTIPRARFGQKPCPDASLKPHLQILAVLGHWQESWQATLSRNAGLELAKQALQHVGRVNSQFQGQTASGAGAAEAPVIA